MDGHSEGSWKKKPSKRKRGRRAPHPNVHPVELRRKAVQLCVEEGFPVAQVARDPRVAVSTLGKWIRKYRTQGEAAAKFGDKRGLRQGLTARHRNATPRPAIIHFVAEKFCQQFLLGDGVRLAKALVVCRPGHTGRSPCMHCG